MLTVDNLNMKNSIKTLEELKKAELPLYIWGAGNVADEVYRLLTEQGISVAGVFVSTDYTNDRKFKNFNILSLEQALEENGIINVLIGHAQYHRKSELEKVEGVNKVYYIINPFRTHDDISYDYYMEHKAEYEYAYSLFEEKYSQKVFQAYLNTRINDNLQYLLECFDKPITYFDNGVFSLTKDENYVDIGAYNGDTLMEFVTNSNNQYEHVYAFEPDAKLFAELEDCVKNFRYVNVDLYKLGLWNSDGELFFESDLGQSDRVADSGDVSNRISVVKLDNIIGDKKVTFIKGALSAGTIEWIEGASEILHSQKPKLVINVGITRELLFAVPRLLHEINSNYSFFLRFNESMPSRLILYAY